MPGGLRWASRRAVRLGQTARVGADVQAATKVVQRSVGGAGYTHPAFRRPMPKPPVGSSSGGSRGIPRGLRRGPSRGGAPIRPTVRTINTQSGRTIELGPNAQRVFTPKTPLPRSSAPTPGAAPTTKPGRSMSQRAGRWARAGGIMVGGTMAGVGVGVYGLSRGLQTDGRSSLYGPSAGTQGQYY